MIVLAQEKTTFSISKILGEISGFKSCFWQFGTFGERTNWAVWASTSGMRNKKHKYQKIVKCIFTNRTISIINISIAKAVILFENISILLEREQKF